MAWLRWLLAVGAIVAAGHAEAQSARAVTTALTVRGSVEQEITLSVDELRRLPMQRVDDVRSGAAQREWQPLQRARGATWAACCATCWSVRNRWKGSDSTSGKAW
jgi:hypothetical protein